MKINNRSCIILGVPLVATIISGLILSSFSVSASDSVVDEINITVPVSCTLSGTGMNTHTAEIGNGLYRADIGTTTIKAFCNDNNGFAIYAAGYTGNEIGGTNSNKLVGTSASGNATIDTGLATSGNVSNWSMKLTALSDSGDTTGTNALTIDSAPNLVNDTPTGADASFSQYHTVPNEYVKVAHKNSATDMNESTGGATITSTYAAYISKTQLADTYSGQVIYTLVHPASAPTPVGENQIGVIYDGNGLTFPGGASTNKVVYERSCEDEYGYIGDTPAILKTRNLNNDGTQNGPYSYEGGTWYEGSGLDPSSAEFEGASKIKVVARYGLTHGVDIISLAFDSVSYDEECGELCDSSINRSGTATYVKKASSFSVYSELGVSQTEIGYDYGVYAQVYPVYDEPTEGATYGVVQNVCSYHPVTGAYAETNPWNGYWYNFDNGSMNQFYYETVDEYDDDWNGVTRYLKNNEENLLGTTITLNAYNPYKINYNGNNATAGTMTGAYTVVDTNTSNTVADLMAPNFKKTGYGFAGWSADQNATVNSSSRIYGPNETIAGSELTFDPTTRETTLYAVWVPTAGTIQNWSGCSSLSKGQVTALTDSRDDNVYTVAKLADGNCWMTENLRLEAEHTRSAADQALAQGYGTSATFGDFSGLADAESTGFTSTYSANSLYSNNGSNNTVNIGSGYDSAYRMPRYNNSNTHSLATSPTNDNAAIYSYGNYYTWAAAMANTIYYNGGTSETVGTSICPKGWKLPLGEYNINRSGSFVYLDNLLGGSGYGGNSVEASNRWREYPNNFVYSGIYVGNSANHGLFGYYWSSTARSSQSSHYLRLISSSVYPADDASKYYGYSIRCVSGT